MPPRILENLENYDNARLASAFRINRNAGNDGKVSLVQGPQGRQELAFEFNILNHEETYIGFDRELPTQDWSSYSNLCLSVRSDRSDRKLVIQFGETDTKIQKKEHPLVSGTNDYCISLRDQYYIDLRLVSYYGVYVDAPPGRRGIIYIDNVRLTP